MKIDIFSHLMPKKYKEALYKTADRSFGMLDLESLSDLDKRFKVMDAFGEDYRQVVTTVGPVPEALGGPDVAYDLARLANDEIAEAVTRHPDRFAAGVGTLPMNNMDGALREAERAVKELGLKGVIIHTPINDKPMDSPEYMPLYELMAGFDLPIWIHPRREQTPDYASEHTSRYWIWCIWGWPYETTAAMTRLVFSGVFDKFPNLKFITHHCGAMVPYFEGRIGFVLRTAKSCGKNFGENLKRPVIDYFRMFYNDTAIHGSTPGLMAAHAFFGPEHILFGSDTPFDDELGAAAIRETIRSVEEMDIPATHTRQLFEDNAKKLLHL